MAGRGLHSACSCALVVRLWVCSSIGIVWGPWDAAWLLDVEVLRVSLSHVLQGMKGLCGLAPSMSSLNWTFFMVYLGLLVCEELCGWYSKGSLKVTCLAVFLKPPGVVRLERVTVSMWD